MTDRPFPISRHPCYPHSSLRSALDTKPSNNVIESAAGFDIVHAEIIFTATNFSGSS